MSKSSSSSSSGIGFLGVLTIAFIVLKLTHYIDWYGGFVLVIVVFVFAYLWAANGVKKQKHVEPQPRYKSKWQERLDELQAKRDERKNSN